MWRESEWDEKDEQYAFISLPFYRPLLSLLAPVLQTVEQYSVGCLLLLIYTLTLQRRSLVDIDNARRFLMDHTIANGEAKEKQQQQPADVVLAIPSEGAPPWKPTRPVNSETLRRRPFFTAAPTFVKPKARFVEPLPTAAHLHDLPSSPHLIMPKTPSVMGDYDDDDVHRIQERRWCGTVRTIVEWSILVSAMACLIASLTSSRLQSYFIWGLEIWRWCLMVAVICCGRLLSQWFIDILVFLIERNFLLWKRVLYYVYGLKNSVQVCIWLGLVLLAWAFLFNHRLHRSPNTAKALSWVSRILASLLIGSMIWLVKTLLVKMLASSFHMNRFFDRIQESLIHQYVLTLLGHPGMELQLSFRNTGGKMKDTKCVGDELEGIDVRKLYRMRQEEVSALRMRGLVNAVGRSGLMTNMLDQSFDDGNEQGEQEITSEFEAEEVASNIFNNVAKPGFKYIEVEDLLRFMTEKEVHNVLQLFQVAGKSRKIEESALKNLVVKAYFDRKSLAHSLNDTKNAVNQLDKLATGAVIIVIMIITLVLMGFATTQVLVFISSQVLLVAFMFGDTCKTAFEAIIFLFVLHPFDVGDRCVVDDMQMIVEETNILTTVFLGSNNEKICYPNSVLATKPITNFYRSPDMGDSVLFHVDVKTSMEFIGSLKARIKEYIDSKPDHWRPTHNILVKDIVDVNKMNMALYVTHTMNYQNIGEKNNRRSDLVLELRKIFQEVSIQYKLFEQEVHLS